MKEKCRYRGHNANTAAIVRPDGKSYDVPIPDNVKNKEVEWFDWIYPLEKSLTTQYYRELELDKIFNIQRDLVTFVVGFRFYYDYKDGIIEVYDITNGPDYSCYRNVKELFNLCDESTHQKIITEMRTQLKLEVKEIKYVDWKWDKERIKYES